MKTPNDHAASLLADGKVKEATVIFREQALRAPSYKSYVNAAIALRASGEFESAAHYISRAIPMDPDNHIAWLTGGNIATDVGQFDQALGYYTSAFARVSAPRKVRNQAEVTALAAAQSQIALALGQSLLRERRFKEAWLYWELGRLNRSWFPIPGTRAWAGEETRSLLVACEGGYGDAMLFARWLPFAKSRARKLTLIVWKPMLTFRDWRALGVDYVIDKGEGLTPEDYEFTTSWMSLPGIAGMRVVDDIPQDDDPELQGYPPHHFPYHGPRDRVGFCWRAEENSVLRRTRSLSTSEATGLAQRLAAHGQVISLCPRKQGLHQDAQDEWPSGVMQDDSLLITWAGTACTIRSCKFVVTVDTAVAHLAGLCGAPTLLLLPLASDWKWFRAETTPFDVWYGRHVHYLRNPAYDSWNVEQVALAVNAFSQVAV